MKELNYKDIALKPQKCVVDSRSECDTSIEFGYRKFDMPVIPANMKSVVNENTCIYLAKKNWFYIMHRFGVDLYEFSKKMIDKNLFISVSVGINKESYNELSNLLKNNIIPEYITIDVANAWSEKCRKMVEYIKEEFPTSFLIVGNVATSEAIREIQTWGVSAIKILIGAGKSCITKNKTGFSRGPISAILDCSSVARIPIIADGGIEEHGDVAKAICLGSNLIMSGYLFSGYEQSAGNIIEIEDTEYKEYYGSASKYNKEEQKNVEGKKILIKYRGDMDRLLTELKQDLQSAISYSGSKDLDGLRGCEYYII